MVVLGRLVRYFLRVLRAYQQWELHLDLRHWRIHGIGDMPWPKKEKNATHAAAL